jgi:folate-binding protein YgfZ
MNEIFEEVVGSRAAIRELGERSLVRVTGGDRIRFLDGMLTNDVASLGPGAVCEALQLDRKGHILAELWVVVLEDAVLLDAASGDESELYEILDKHIIADDVELEHLGSWDRIGIEGPGAAAAIEAQGLRMPAPGRFETDERGRIWLAGGTLGSHGARVLGERATIEDLRRALGLSQLSAEAGEVLRIDAFLPAHGLDFGERNFPQEARLEGLVSSTKGCYVGQEIVARIDSRGAVNRLLVKLRTEAPVSRDAEIRAGGASVGRVTSAAVSDETGPIAMGYVRKSVAEPGSSVEIEGVPGKVTSPDSAAQG